MRPIAEIESELREVISIDDENLDAIGRSDRPQIDRLFAASSAKRRSMLERELSAAKAERAHELFGLKLHTPQFSPGTISLRVLAKLAPLINEAIERTAWREWDVHGESSAIDDSFRRLINLRLAGINAGSTELVFMGNISPDLTGESALESGLRNLFGVLGASNEDITYMVNGIGENATKSLMQLMKTLESENIGAEFTWDAPGKRFFWDGRPDQITRVRALLEEFGEAKTAQLRIRGVISALSRRRVQIESDDEKYGVRYHRSLSAKVNALHLDQNCVFIVEETSYPSDKTGIKRTAYRLIDVEESGMLGELEETAGATGI